MQPRSALVAPNRVETTVGAVSGDHPISSHSGVPGNARAQGEGEPTKVYAEEWDPSYGAPATFDFDDQQHAELAEPSGDHVNPRRPAPLPLCFIDGRRRGELGMWAERAGVRTAGLAGCYAVGAVTVRPSGLARYEGITLGRVALWGGGHHQDIVSSLGYRWEAQSTTASDPGELLDVLQERMRAAEGDLALEAARLGWNVILDGPLNRIRGLHPLVTGYVKTHRRQILSDDQHHRVPDLPIGGRTALYTTGSDRYTCYVRVGNPGPGGSPWSGIARLDLPASAGLDAVAEHATQLAATLPLYAGVPHRDPRAPINLTPVRNLELHLSQRMGPVAHARRAARDALIRGGTR